MSHFSVEHYPFTHEFNEAALYNRVEYLSQNETDNLIRFNWVVNNKAIIGCNLYTQKHNLINARYSSFGGVEFSIQGLPVLDKFMDALILWCSDNGIAQVQLKLPSSVYSENYDHLLQLLNVAGFTELVREVNQHLVVSEEIYSEVIKYNERKKLRRCKEQRFEFKYMQSDQLHQAYRLIADTRIRNTFPVSMTLDKLRKMFSVFPDNYFLFGVYDSKRLIAVAVSIKINRNILYNFYHGDDIEYRSYSPIVMLLEGIYGYCQRENFEYLDLGISSVHGKLNHGLYKFKENCGCIATAKPILVKELLY